MGFSVETFCDRDENSNTYLISDEASCIIIDPSNNVKILKKYIEGKKLLGVFLTHGHYDHFKVLEDVIRIYNVPVYVHKKALEKLNDPNLSYAKAFGYDKKTIVPLSLIRFVNSGEKIILDKFSIYCMYTPGHTNCMMSYIIDDMMFTGDFIFKNGIGRTDLYSGSMISMMNSINDVKKLKVNYHLFPGHGESSFLFDEIKNNPYLNRN